MLELDANQQHVIDDLLLGNHKGGAIIAPDTGAGKTAVGVAICKAFNAQVVLLVAPLNTRVGWKRHIEGMGLDLPFYDLGAAPASFDRLLTRQPGVYFIGREFLHKSRKATKTRPAWDWSRVKPDIALYDEIHACQSRKSQSFKTWKQIKPRDLKVGISAHWFGNKFEGAWAVTKGLWPDEISNSFWSWVLEWCDKSTLQLRGREVQQIVGEKNPGEFVKTLPAYYAWTYDVGVEYVEQDPLYVDMTPAQEKMYRQMETDLMTWIGQNPLVADLPITKYARLRQMSLAVPSLTWDNEEVYFEDNAASPKLDALKEYLLDVDEPVLILTDSMKFAKIAAKRVNAELWIGATTQDDREALAARFSAGEVPRLVATIQSIGTGLDGLQANCHRVVWLSKSNNPVENSQAEGRLYRRGQTEPVISVEIRTVGTEDDPQHARLIDMVARREASLNKEEAR